jgi:thiol:disulfide interchange protein DsbC
MMNERTGLMKIVRFFATGCFALSLILASTVQAASPKGGPRETLRKLYPKLKFTSVTKTDIDGLYEVMADGKIAYFHPKTGYLIFGDIVTSQGRNLTQERIGAEMYKLLTPQDLKKAIKVGTGKSVVIEITDPDCPYCRKMHAFWSSRSDVTRYIFLNPLDMHPDAVKKSTFILASVDPEKALFDVYSGHLDGNRQMLDKKYDDKGRLQEQKAVAEKLKVDATPTYWVNGTCVPGANIKLIEKLLDKAGHSQ